MATQIKTGLIANDAITDAKIANVALTGVTASSGDSSTSLATTAFVATEINSLIDSAPGALNTLNELAAAMGDDANFSTTVTNNIATKAPLDSPVFSSTYTSGQDKALAEFRRDGGAVAAKIIYADASTDIEFGTTTSHGLSLITADTRRLTINNSGNATFTGTIASGAITSTGNIITDYNDTIAMSYAPGPTDYYKGMTGTSFNGASTARGLHLFNFDNDSNLGINFWVGTSASKQFAAIIDDSGKVGIGVSNPSAPLHIQTNDGTTNSAVNSLIITNLSTGTTTTGFGGEIRFQAERNNGVNQNTGGIRSIAEINSGVDISSGMAFDTSAAGVNSEKLRISWDGNVGIGTSDPNQLLSVKGRISSDFNDSYYGAWLDGNSASSQDNFLGLGPWHNNAGYIKFIQSASPDRLSIYTTNTSDHVTLQEAGGKVGIGTTSPTLPFEVHGANNNTFAGSSLGTPGTILVQGTDVSGSGYAGGGILFAGDYHTNGSTTTFAAIAGIKESTTNGEYAGALTFGTREGGTGAGNFERMRISSVGNVSVGTSSAFGQTTNRTCFTVNGTSSVSLNIGVGAAQKGYLYTDGNITQLGSVGSIPLKFAPNDSPKLELSVSGELSLYGNKMVIDSDYGSWNGRYQHLTCHNTITSSNTWTDVAYVSYSPSLTIQGMAQRDNNGALGASNFLGTVFGGYGATAVAVERSVANPMNGGGFGALEYRYLNSGASSGSYRLQVKISIGAGTMYVTTTLTGHAWQEIYED